MTEKKENNLFLWLWRRFLRRHRGWLAVAIVMMMIEGSMMGLLALMMEPMFDDVFTNRDEGALRWVGIGILLIFLVRAVTSIAQRVILTRISERSAAQIRSTLLRHLMRLDAGFFQNNPPGYLIERVQGDVGSINSVWSALITGAGRDVIAVIWLFGVAISVDWLWTLIALIGVPFLLLPSWIAQRFVRRQSLRAREFAGRMSTRLDEVFHGINPIKLNTLEDYQSRRYEDLVEHRISAEIASSFGRASIPGLIDIMTGIGFFGVLIYGGSEILTGEKSVGEFMSFFTAMALAFEPLRRIGNLSGLWQSAAASLERVQALLLMRPSLIVPKNPLPAPAGAPELRLEGVNFAYEDLPVLHGLTLVAEAGKTTALVGASGAGKSTVFNILTRLVDPQSGSISISGVPISSLEPASLRGLFSVVTQEALLFDESLRENILLDRTDVSDAELARVLDAAHVTEFVAQMPEGLESPAGPRGTNLSGGQRQRIAIARALLRDTPILLLDEATSALDVASEAAVQDALDRLSEGRTTLVIAHRLSTVRHADKILVMKDGQVVEEGRHDDLLAKGGAYADLYAMQFKDEAAMEGQGA